MWDDYYEPSEFEQQIELFKQSIRENVKQEIQDEIDNLKAENAKLQEIKENWAELTQEHERALLDLRMAKQNAEMEARRTKATEILKELCFVGYRPKVNLIYPPKCDKCDEQRYIHFKSPLGREMKEECTCKQAVRCYEPSKVRLMDFYIRDKVSGVYYERKDEKEYDHYDMAAEVYHDFPNNPENVNYYRAVFANFGDCARYCEWLMQQMKAEKRKADGGSGK